MNQPVIEIRGFSFATGGKTILDSISLDILAGEYCSVIGPNGAGKSTLLKCLMRINHSGMGPIVLKGKPLASYHQRDLAKIMSYVPQSDGRLLPFSVKEFVMMGRYPHLSPFTSITKEDRKVVDEALVMTGTAHLAVRLMNTLSGGERQTVYIAAALAQGAEIMLLDEPTTFLDPRHESDILRIIKKINREYGITIISVTHDINIAALESDRIISLKNGAVVFIGAAVDLMDNDVLEAVYGRRFTFITHPVTGSAVILPEVYKT